MFRLAVQNNFPTDIASTLPLDSSQGLDSFLTVTTKFPRIPHLPKGMTLCVIDTPGVNEDGVKKLDLHHVIEESIQHCYYVSFTTTTRVAEGIDSAGLKSLVKHINSTSKTLNLVMVTNSDMDAKSTKDMDITRQNIANGLRNGNLDYPTSKVFIVSGKRMMLGAKMQEFLTQHDRKPEVNSQDPTEAQLVEDFYHFAGDGFEEDERLEWYEEQTRTALEKKCAQLIKRSEMEKPMNQMIDTSVQNAAIVSSNKAIETP